ncbi:hemerythrin domain-containing protein [Oribacterium sp. WCC10]|uniref:hemerythrin domain-containing protein n=1 Tax=Oribacterium sp. WCC10 TaxID=1855343 RepID=UPI0008E97F9E|nr:hemerythrin domain-containing protein [Oribacterium sp. WCC10]SFG16171.1 Hemerythrin-like domain-containing protein [Oribacterium sp. WCC10]
MYCTDIMVEEHENILRFLTAVRSMCCKVLDGSELVTEDFCKIIDFARNYSDHHHHGKEEKFLFNEMESRMGAIGQNLIRHGMLVEHELCRAHILDLENALSLWEKEKKTIYKLDILEAAMGYATLLTRHIKKENAVVYPFAEKQLDKAVLDSVNEKVAAFEAETEKQGIQKKYLDMIDYMIKTYGSVEDQHDLIV